MKERREALQAISVEKDGVTTEAAFSGAALVLDTLIDADIEISHSCGGMGTCGTCRIEVLSPLGQCQSRNEVEQEMALDRSFGEHERLACQLHAFKGLKVRVPR
jgi:2Fe-2S ferredoxin